jgi:Ras-related protein Rab-1A
MPIYTRAPAAEPLASSSPPSKYDYLFKIVIIGQSGTGKSCLLRRYCDNTFSDSFISTIGVDFQNKLLNLRGKSCNMQIWDTSGQERFRTITSSYYRGAKGVVIVYDCQDSKSVSELDYWLSQAHRYVGENIPVLIVGNKIDLPSAVSAQEVQKFATKHGCLFIETSAKTGINVEEAFEKLCTACVEQIGNTHHFPNGGQVKLDSASTTNWCCGH